MEQKTIGGFIAALRKANGMTQKTLAEKLHVSDKSISRWERDDGAPDLSLIPVIAEIFGVTCDELLRGERRPMSERTISAAGEEPTPKGEKQRQRLLTVSLSHYKTKSLIAMGIAVVGLLAAMVGNFGFLRAYIGFLIGAVFYLASAICQVIFLNSAFLSVSDDSLAGVEIGRFKRSVVRLAEWSFGLTAVLLAFSLPLVLYPIDTYAGLTAGFWFPYGLIWAGIAFLVCGIVCYFLNAALLKKGICTLSEQEEQVYRHNHKLKRRCALILLAALLVTWIGNAAATSGWDAPSMADGITFDDYESFVAFMEQDIPSFYGDNSVSVLPEQDVSQGSVTYYDEFGNEISEEEALRTTLTDSAGNVVCEFMDRNQTVSSIRYTEKDGSLLPITVITRNDLYNGHAKIVLINTVFAVVYCVEAAIALILYFRKRAK